MEKQNVHFWQVSIKVLLLLFLQACCTCSVKIGLSNRTDSVVWPVDINLFAQDEPGPFSLETDGRITVDISVKEVEAKQGCLDPSVPPYLHIYIFDSSQQEELSTAYGTINCNEPEWDDIDRCWYYQPAASKFVVPMNESLHATSRVASTDEYYLYLVNPCLASYKIEGYVMMKNPWDEFAHLDVANRWYPQTILSAMIIYVTILVVWCWYCYHHQDLLIVHHKLITAIIAFRVVEFFAYYVSYAVYDATGTATDYDLLAYDMLNSGFEVTSLIFLLFVAMGHTLYRPSIQMRQMRVAIFCIVVYAVICFFEEVCFLFEDYCHFVRLFQFIVRCFLLVGIVALLNALISSVQNHIKSASWKNELKNAYLLLHAHKVLRWGFYLYITLPIVVTLLDSAVLDWTESWIVDLINFVFVEPFLLAYIFYHFRPSPHLVHVNGIIPI